MNYYKTKESVDEYIRLAKDVNGGQLINRLKNFLEPNSELLEIGSGPGTDWKILNENYRVTGSDNSPEFLDRLIKNNPNGKFLELHATTLKTDKLFDGIYSNKVLHHLKNNELESSIKEQVNILNPDGIICHSFWKGVGEEVYHGLLVNYHSHTDLKEFFGKYFEILVLDNYKEFDDEDSILLIARKKNQV